MECSKSGGKHPFLTLLLVGLFIGDVFTDVATGIELILNDHQVWGYCVLALVSYIHYIWTKNKSWKSNVTIFIFKIANSAISQYFVGLQLNYYRQITYDKTFIEAPPNQRQI